MANSKERVRNPSTTNRNKCLLGIKITRDGIENSVKIFVQNFQKKSLNKILENKGLPLDTVCNMCTTQNMLSCPTRGTCTIRFGTCDYHDDNYPLKTHRPCPNGICDDLRDIIYNNHRFRDPSWIKTDAKQWGTNSWEIAKCFIAADHYGSNTSARDTDFQGLVSVVINLIFVQNMVADDLCREKNIFCQAINIRNTAVSSTVELPDAQLICRINTMIKLLNDQRYLAKDRHAQAAIIKLEQLKTEILPAVVAEVETAVKQEKTKRNRVMITQPYAESTECIFGDSDQRFTGQNANAQGFVQQHEPQHHTQPKRVKIGQSRDDLYTPPTSEQSQSTFVSLDLQTRAQQLNKGKSSSNEMSIKELYSLSQSIGIEWEDVGLLLQFKIPQIDHLKMMYPNQTQGRIRTMLHKWHDVVVSCGENPKLLLAGVFVELKNEELASKIINRDAFEDASRYEAKPSTIQSIHNITFDAVPQQQYQGLSFSTVQTAMYLLSSLFSGLTGYQRNVNSSVPANINMFVKEWNQCGNMAVVRSENNIQRLRTSRKGLPSIGDSQRVLAHRQSVFKKKPDSSGLETINHGFRPSKPSRYEEYREEQRRIVSFTNWPHQDSMLDFKQMAEQGLFWTGIQDLVRCYHCGIGLNDWLQKDNPLYEHMKYSPHCEFLANTVDPGQIRQYKTSLLPLSINDACSGEIRSPSETHEAYTIPLPEYKLMGQRVTSFTKWPSGISQTPAQLAEAGFYYTGIRDVVRCFTCDGALHRWDPEEDPWIEHARWFPECAHVIQVKGKEFIQLVKQAIDHAAEDEDEDGGIAQGFSNTHTKNGNNKCWKAKNLLNLLLDKEDRGEVLPIDSPRPEETPVMPLQIDTTTEEGLLEERSLLLSRLKCIRCRENDVNVLFLPCTHHRMCVNCAADVTMCPICGKTVKEKIETYMA